MKIKKKEFLPYISLNNSNSLEKKIININAIIIYWKAYSLIYIYTVFILRFFFSCFLSVAEQSLAFYVCVCVFRTAIIIITMQASKNI